MHLAAALIYWVIVGFWSAILIVVVVSYLRNDGQLSAVRLLLSVVAIDTVRNIIENVYFGTYFGAQYGLFPGSIIGVLGDPRLLIVPKVINVLAACSVFALLLFRWLPRSIKERNAKDRDLNQAERKFQLLVDSVNEYAIYLLDADGRITSWNSGAQRIKGYAAPEIMGHHVEEFYTTEDRLAKKPAEALETAARAGQYEIKAWRIRKDGSKFWANVVIDAIRDEAGTLLGFAKVTKDITESLLAEERLTQLAHFDQLTGLPNRVSLMRDIHRILGAERIAAAVGIFDLDGFKDINDTHGHSVGDQVLKKVADLARDIQGKRGSFYRLGGDEFVFLLPQCRDPLEATGFADVLLRRLQNGIDIDERRLFLGASAGISLAPTDSSDAEELLAFADLALYEAKQSGGRKCGLFAPTMRAKVRERQKLDVELRRASAEEEFVLYYQPQIRLSDGAIVGAEALLRWQHPQSGVVAPGAFIEALAASPAALDVGNWILRKACMTASEWVDAGLPVLRIGVNLFPAQFHDDGLLAVVESALRDSGLPPEALELEITENVAFVHDDKIMTTLQALRKKGVGIAFDDFGTGYASLSCLTKYPLTRVKIDRSFVSNITRNCPKETTAVVRSVVAMAHNLGFEVIAEGVETSEQAAFLRSKRCDEVQGYFYSQPLRAEDFKAFVRDRELARLGSRWTTLVERPRKVATSPRGA